MKKNTKQFIIFSIIISTIISLATFNVTCFAFETISTTDKLVNTLIPTGQLSNTEASVELQLVKNLPNPQKGWVLIIADIIKLMLQISGALAALAFTWGGVMMVTAQGNDEKIKKGRNIIMLSIMALIIMAVSYAIILGVSQLKFFS